MSDEEFVKTVFTTGSGDDVYIETPWARHLGGTEYVLDNLPFYAYGISSGDVFEATPEPNDERPHFRRVLRKSGNRTVRVVLKPGATESPESQAVLDRLNELGCTYEGANDSYIAVEVPAGIELRTIGEYLTSTGQQWEHADPTYEELYPADSAAE